MTDKPSPWSNPKKDDNKPEKDKDLPDWNNLTKFPKKPKRRKKNEDLAELLRKLNLGGGSGDGQDDTFSIDKRHIIIVVLLIIVGWLCTGFYQIAPEEQGVVMRFGKYVYTTGPGLHYHLPYPIEEVLKPNVMRENRIEIGFRSGSSDYRRAGDSSVNSVPKESLMLTGDENIVEVNYTVTWKISNAGYFLFNLRDPVGTVAMAAESAMREVVGQTPIADVITGGREKIQDETKKKLQSMMDEYNAGIQISAVQMLKVDPPAQVIDAFNDVQRAKADRERIRNEAEAYRNDIIPKARGEAAKLVQEAEAYKEQTINFATGDANRFLAVLKEYKEAKDVTSRRMYLEAMEQVLSGVNKIIVEPSAGGNVVPYLPLSELNLKKETKEGK
jgi:membrane protease subunit HflK